jgi:hypothetical protein
MRPNRSLLRTAALVIAVVLLLAGCGGGGHDTSGDAQDQNPAQAQAGDSGFSVEDEQTTASTDADEGDDEAGDDSEDADDEGEDSPTTTTRRAVKPLATGTTPSPATPTTPAERVPTAAEASSRLVTAWKAGDQTAARKAATADVVDELFAEPAPDGEAEGEGCTGASGGYTCTWSVTDDAGLALRVQGGTAAGWLVTGLTFVG